jgi:hypothetical protein
MTRFGDVRWLAAGAFTVLGSGCGSRAEPQTSEPIVLGMQATDAPIYDDGETTIYQASRPVSLPLRGPGAADLAVLRNTAPPPFARAPWSTLHEVKVQIAWTVSNLDEEAHNVEILIDPWNEFVRYVPAVNVGEEETIPDLSGIQLLLRVEGRARRSGTFTFADLDELATDLATVQNILARHPTPAPGDSTVNGMVNHAFDLQNRTDDGDRLLAGYVPGVVPALVGFDLGLRSYGPGSVAVEIIVELLDGGNRVIADAPIRTDGTSWIAPEANISAPMGQVR